MAHQVSLPPFRLKKTLRRHVAVRVQRVPRQFVMFSVYQARYVTTRGTLRDYLGYTGCVDQRVGFLKGSPPAFMRAMAEANAELKVKVLESGLATKAAARAVEALLAARAIAKAPRHTRGGPWSKPGPLGVAVLAEVRAVASCRSLVALAAVAEEFPGGPLWRHLRDLKFARAAVAPRGADTVRGAYVYKPKKSGTPGNTSRRRRLTQGKLKRGTLAHQRSHRGRDPTACRQRETGRRPARN